MTGQTTEPTGEQKNVTGQIWRDGEIQKGREHERESEATVSNTMNKACIPFLRRYTLFFRRDLDLTRSKVHICSHNITHAHVENGFA